MWNLKTQKVILSRDVFFNENAHWNWESNSEQFISASLSSDNDKSVRMDDSDAQNSIQNSPQNSELNAYDQNSAQNHYSQDKSTHNQSSLAQNHHSQHKFTQKRSNAAQNYLFQNSSTPNQPNSTQNQSIPYEFTPQTTKKIPESSNSQSNSPPIEVLRKKATIQRRPPTPTRLQSLDDILARCNFCVIEPGSYDEVVHDVAWQKAMEEEIATIEKNQTWELVDRPSDKLVVGVKWVYKTKRNLDGIVLKNKARLVEKGYSQKKIFAS